MPLNIAGGQKRTGQGYEDREQTHRQERLLHANSLYRDSLKSAVEPGDNRDYPVALDRVDINLETKKLRINQRPGAGSKLLRLQCLPAVICLAPAGGATPFRAH